MGKTMMRRFLLSGHKKGELSGTKIMSFESVFEIMFFFVKGCCTTTVSPPPQLF